MKQEERLDYLLEKFKEDSGRYRDLQVGDSKEEKQTALRSLMNIRMPRMMNIDVIKVQDEYLAERAQEKGIVTLPEIKTIKQQYNSNNKYNEKISLWQGDITRLGIDAIVNAANSQMLGCFIPMHNCIDNCVHTFAGIQLRAECNRQMNQRKIKFGPQYEEPTGEAMLTPGYNLPAKYVIHTVGPIVQYRLTKELRNDLRKCYTSILKCCVENNIRSVAICCISTGVFRFPNDEAAKIAVETVTEFLEKYSEKFDRIIFNVFKDIDKEYYEKLLI